MSWKRQLVEALPGPLEDMVRSAHKYVHDSIPIPYRYGREFREMYAFLQESQWWSREELEEYQMRQLEKLLRHAYENVPYYRRVFDESGLRPNNIQDFNDLRRLPTLSKDDVRANLTDLIARNIPKGNMQYVTTGGTSGKPLGFYIERRTNLIRNAFDWRHYNWMGYEFGDRCAVLRGNVVKRLDKGRPAWWEYDRSQNYLILSVYHLTDGNLPKYLEKTRDFQPKIIRAYPSAIDILARFIKDNDLEINENGNLAAIATSSENLFAMQRERIEEVFNCKIFDLYGNCEQVARMGECESHQGYHVFPEYGIIELLEEDDELVAREGALGEIVATGFTNYAVPLIRYRTEDFGVYTSRPCFCGRTGLPLLLETRGRWYQERIVTRNGNYIPITALNSHSDIFDNVRQFQYYQDEIDRVVLRVVPKESYTDRDTKKILQELGEKLQGQVELEIQFLDEIPRTDRGKYRFLVQKLPIEFGEHE